MMLIICCSFQFCNFSVYGALYLQKNSLSSVTYLVQKMPFGYQLLFCETINTNEFINKFGNATL